MHHPLVRLLSAAGFLATCLLAHAADPQPTEPEAEVTHHWRAALSPYSLHFRPSEEHEHVWAVAVERQYSNRWLFGVSFFSNSFGQPSGYLYAGQRYDALFNTPQLFWQWSIGLMYGYVDQYEDKVPLNYRGFSPGAILSLGWQFNRQLSAQINTLGDAGLMFQFSYDFR